MIEVVTNQNQKYFKCYYCDDFETDLDAVYQRHVEDNHPSKPVYRIFERGDRIDWNKKHLFL